MAVETKEILITITGKFITEGARAFRNALRDFSGQKVAGQFGFAAKQAGLFRGALSSLGGPLGLLRGGLSAVTGLFSGFIGILTSVVKTAGLAVVGIGALAGVLSAKLGKAAISANLALQDVRTNLESVVGEDIAGRQVQILRDLARQFGVSFQEISQAARSAAVATRGNEQAFSGFIQAVIQLSRLDPAQGISGAVLAVSEAISGDFLSLRRRFEIAPEIIERSKEFGDSLSRLQFILEEIGAGSDLLARSQNTLRVAWGGVLGIVEQFITALGAAPFEALNNFVVRLRDRLQQIGPQLVAVGQFLGEFAVDIVRALGFSTDSLLEALDPEKLLEGGLNLIEALAEGILIGLERFVLPAILAVANLIASFLAGSSPPALGPLSDIIAGGRNMIAAYVQGITQGLDSAALKEVAQGITNNLINLEQQELNAKRTIANLQKLLKSAQKEVQRARDRLRIFTIETADIPERFTRNRRRQLELSILQAEQEARRRKDALDSAKAQAAALREILQAQQKVLSNVERLLREQLKLEKAAESEAVGIDTGRREIEISDFSARVQAALAGFREKFGAQRERILGLFGDIGSRLGEFGAQISAAFADVGLDDILTRFNQLADIWDNLAAVGAFLIDNVLAPFAGKITDVANAVRDVNAAFQEGGFIGAAVELFGDTDAGEQLQSFTKLADPTELGKSIIFPIVDAATRELLGASTPMSRAAEGGIADPILAMGAELWNRLVGNSIFPELTAEIESIFTDLLPTMQQIMSQLSDILLGPAGLGGIQSDWNSIFSDMLTVAMDAQRKIEGIKLETLASVQAIRTELQIVNQLNLDAAETRNLMQQGVYQGITQTFGR